MEGTTKRSQLDSASRPLTQAAVADNSLAENSSKHSPDSSHSNVNSLDTIEKKDNSKIKFVNSKEEDWLLTATEQTMTQPKDDIVVEIEMQRVPITLSPDDEDENWTDSDADSEDDDNVTPKGTILSKGVLHCRRGLSSSIGAVVEITNGYLTKIILLLGYIAYLIAALIYRFDDEGSYRLLGFTLLGAFIMTRSYIFSGCHWLITKVTGIEKMSPKLTDRLNTARFFSRWLMYGAVAAVMAWIIIDKAIHEPKNLSSLPGIVIIVLLCLFCSTKPDRINYHTVFWGLGLQFIFCLLVLKWQFGKSSIVWLQTRLDEFFDNSAAGSKFLFGDDYEDHYIMFGALPLLFFTNGILSLLYYLGAMQLLVKVIGNFLTFVLETSGIESMAVAAGIFMEGVTSLTAFRPYLRTLTRSQMFLVVTSCLSSIGGAYLAVLSKMGVSVEFIIGAMLVSAPATFTVCKLIVPETRDLNKEIDKAVSKIGDEEKGKYANAMDAMQTGALNMLPVVGNIAVSAFSLICFIEWTNQTMIWFGDRIGVNGLSMEFIASYILFPISLMMGIELHDCRRVAMLNGYRIVSSNIVGFFKLTEMRDNRYKYNEYMLHTNGTGNVTYINDDIILEEWGQTLPLGFISLRSEAIMTYCLCGFSSFLSVAIHLGMMASFVPKRKRWFAEMAPVAFIAGNLANIMTGCFACIFY